MDTKIWHKYFPGAITVTDENGDLTYMNDASKARPEMQVGYDLIGHNAITCHKESTQPKVQKLYDEHLFNIYMIKLNGQKQLVYMAPYFVDGEFKGITELVLYMPDEVPFFDRDAEKVVDDKEAHAKKDEA